MLIGVRAPVATALRGFLFLPTEGGPLCRYTCARWRNVLPYALVRAEGLCGAPKRVAHSGQLVEDHVRDDFGRGVPKASAAEGQGNGAHVSAEHPKQVACPAFEAQQIGALGIGDVDAAEHARGGHVLKNVLARPVAQRERKGRPAPLGIARQHRVEAAKEQAPHERGGELVEALFEARELPADEERADR